MSEDKKPLRTLTSVHCTAETHSVTNLAADLQRLTVAGDEFIAYHLDGVLEGRWSDHHNVSFSTLTELRVFNATREVYAWRMGDTWMIRVITDDFNTREKNTDCFDESYIHVEKSQSITLRHYLQADDLGFITICASRFVTIGA